MPCAFARLLVYYTTIYITCQHFFCIFLFLIFNHKISSVKSIYVTLSPCYYAIFRIIFMCFIYLTFYIFYFRLYCYVLHFNYYYPYKVYKKNTILMVFFLYTLVFNLLCNNKQSSIRCPSITCTQSN